MDGPVARHPVLALEVLHDRLVFGGHRPGGDWRTGGKFSVFARNLMFENGKAHPVSLASGKMPEDPTRRVIHDRLDSHA